MLGPFVVRGSHQEKGPSWSNGGVKLKSMPFLFLFIAWAATLYLKRQGRERSDQRDQNTDIAFLKKMLSRKA
jgi:hypothetical protein